MNEESKHDAANDTEDEQTPDLELIFAPSWARQSPDTAVRHAERWAQDADRNDGGRPERRPFGARGPERDARPPHRDREGPRSADGRGAFRRERAPGDRRGPGTGFRSDTRSDARPSPAFVRQAPQRPLPLDVRFLPEQKALGAIIRRIQTTRRAYPVRDIVRLFQNSDESLLVRIEGLKEAEDVPQLFQCRVCGMPALSENDVREHLRTRHMEDFFDVVEVEGEAPSGNFPCVARCGLSGEWLGPPNHHSFNLRVQEMLRDRYPNMSLEAYRSRVEMVRDPEAVEAWREASRRKKLYRRKPNKPEVSEAVDAPARTDAPTPEAAPEAAADTPAAPEAPAAPAVERHVAELQFNREIVPMQIGSAKHLVCPANALKNLPDRRLASLLSARLDEETRRHGSLFFAIHGAFRHRGLFFFRAGDERGPEFVMGTRPLPMDTTHVVARLRQILAHVTDHPSCTQPELVQNLSATVDEAAIAEVATQVQWLVEKGHLIEFYNGMLTLPATYPVFRPHGPAPKRTDRNVQTEPAAAQDPSPAVPEATAAVAGAPAPAACSDIPADTAQPAPGAPADTALAEAPAPDHAPTDPEPAAAPSPSPESPTVQTEGESHA